MAPTRLVKPLRQAVGVEQLGERRGRIEVGHHDGRGRHLALAQLDTDDRAALDDDAGHLGVAAQLTTVLLEQPGQVISDGAQATPDLRHGRCPRRCQRKGEAHRAPGREGSPEGRIDREEGQHAAHGRVLRPVGKIAVDDVHHAAEHGGADRLALSFVGGAVPHFVQRLRRRAHVEAADGAGRGVGPRRHLGHAQYRLDPDRLAEVLQESFRVRVEENRRLAVLADTGGLDLRLVNGAGAEVEVLEDLVRHRELNGAGQLEAIAADELRRRRHAADEVVLLHAEDPQAAAGHDRRCGQAVVTCPDHNGVVVTHCNRTVATSGWSGRRRHPAEVPDRPEHSRHGPGLDWHVMAAA